MKQRLQLIVIFVAIAGIIFVALQLMEDKPATVKVGAKAPDFTLPAFAGGELSLEQYRGQGVLINFWATWCEPCINELPLLDEAHGSMDGVQIIAVNLGERLEKVQKYVDELGLQLPIALDRTGSQKKPYQIINLPVTIMVDEKGIVSDIRSGEIWTLEEVTAMMKQIQP